MSDENGIDVLRERVASVKEETEQINRKLDNITNLLTDPDKGFGPRLKVAENWIGEARNREVLDVAKEHKEMVGKGLWDAVNQADERVRRKVTVEKAIIGQAVVIGVSIVLLILSMVAKNIGLIPTS